MQAHDILQVPEYHWVTQETYCSYALMAVKVHLEKSLWELPTFMFHVLKVPVSPRAQCQCFCDILLLYPVWAMELMLPQ